MLGMLQLLARHQHIEELAGVTREAQDVARENQGKKETDRESIGGEARATSAPDARFKAALKYSLRASMFPARFRN